MTSSSFVLPQPVGHLLSRLPAYPGSWLFVAALNLALAKQLQPDVTQLLVGKKLRLRVTDAQWNFDFEWQGDQFRACQTLDSPDLTISASAHDFVLLARREEDPDTLFFSRRLSMEGDTELGLMVKNTIDGIELPVFSLDTLRPSQVLKRLKTRFPLP